MMFSPQLLVGLLNLSCLALASPNGSPQSIPRRPHGGDDAPQILAAVKKCNNGGTVVLDKVYRIASPLDLTFLQHIDIIITGEIHFADEDVYYWAENSFKYKFQNQSVFWKLGGEDVNIYGDLGNDQSVIDGHGQAYWEEIRTNKSLFRPMLFAFDGMHGAVMSNLRMRNPPHWFNIIGNSSDMLISDMHLNATSLDGVVIANSDGWDTYRSDRVVIQDSVIWNTDDCVSFKPNSTNIVIQNLVCHGSHGISVGSLGQYAGEVDIVEDLYIYNISMANASDAINTNTMLKSFAAIQFRHFTRTAIISRTLFRSMSDSKPTAPLALPSSESTSDGSTNLTLGGTVSMDALGPVVVNVNGTLSRINNWAEMNEIERENTLRVLGKRNRQRREALLAAQSAEEEAAKDSGKE
ncbi:hypothetical protein BN1708_012652 [Verticillium longisporum]|uniref:galacturonan 1,4-alpha-galacturonidase n=2 Tax=Verticillium longisporum TaxID=100787 RepID=A0A0G4LCR4_VERLO|nr:hypothetical protein BN1708_012652 [Verticillium longisporum]